ncbi:MAG: hypothetical protein ABI454_12610 [Sphingomicrobium sp.]
MNPFEFIILFFSFIYTLALTHLLFAATRMVRHRRQLVLSWPHLLWMLVALGNLAANWISLWDFRSEGTLSLGTIAIGFLLVIINYALCALVSPDFEGGETYDLKRFHECEGPTYIAAMLALVLASIAVNFLAGAALDIANWADENSVVIANLVPLGLALAVKRPWAQLLAPIALLATVIAYAVIYYPALTA